MIKVYVNEKFKATTAVIGNNDMDAVNKVLNRLGLRFITDSPENEVKTQRMIQALELKQLIMPKVNKATVICDERDNYTADAGKKEAIAKAQRNYSKSLKKAFERWQLAMLKKIYIANPETFEAACKKMDTYLKSINTSK